MGLSSLSKKMATYNERLESGKAGKIKPEHVKKVLAKLHKKAAELEEEIDSARKKDKKTRLKRKLGIAREHVERAEWLLKEIS